MESPPPQLLNIWVDGRHGSIADFTWVGIPPFCVVTGLNGAGKTHLLEAIAASTDALGSRDQFGAKVLFEGETYSRGDVFHSYGEWRPLTSAPADEDLIRRAIQNLMARRLGAVKVLASELRLDPERLHRLTPQQFLGVLSPGLLWSYEEIDAQTLSFLFLAYRYLERAALVSSEEQSSWRARLGEPPWEVLRSVIAAAGLNFDFNVPPELPQSRFTTNQSFDFRLRDIEGRVVPFDRLSSGERVLMSTALWRCKSEIAGKQYRLLLLDEPDAHLHPALTRRFLNVVKSAFVEERNVRVIMTTHSPTTVALIPRESLFEMTRSEPRIRVTTRESAIAILTQGFVAVQDATRTVLLEGKTDPPFYRLVWRMLTEPYADGRPNFLNSYPNINFVRGTGRQTVQELVPQMRLIGLANFAGIIDRDSANLSADGIYVLGRRAIENYLFDPLVIWLALAKRRLAPTVASIPAKYAVFNRHPQSALQDIVTAVAEAVEQRYPVTDTSVAEVQSVRYVNGVTLNYPVWCLTRHKRELKNQYSTTYCQFSTEELLDAFSEANMITVELADLLGSVQRDSFESRVAGGPE